MPNDSAGRPARHASVGRRLTPVARLTLAIAVIVAGLAIPPRYWPAHGVLATLVFVGQTLAGVPMRYLARRLALFLPAAAVFALSIPLAHGGSDGWELAAALFLRMSLAFLAALWLIHVLPPVELFSTLRRLRVPPVMVAMLTFMYRYLLVLRDELLRMRTARRARLFGDAGIATRWRTSAQMVGMLVIRGMDRAERVRGAMCARGWDGRVRSLDDPPAAAQSRSTAAQGGAA